MKLIQAIAIIAVTLGLMTGCASAPRKVTQINVGAPYRLQVGDAVHITIKGITTDDLIEEVVDENGNVTLPYINLVFAEGKTSSELESSIHRAYVTEKIYKKITINVLIDGLEYYVQGEVKGPGKYNLEATRMTVSQAIAAAGGFTDFAKKTGIKIRRGTEIIPANMKKISRYPERDIPLEAGDVIDVPRKFF